MFPKIFYNSKKGGERNGQKRRKREREAIETGGKERGFSVL